ncbi:haloacid dehalogenase [Salipaludibacillus keqinensis]|uniref:Haloacid dehalogenase n=1 Tax=Salipaludibacillus keqinensis TaxID=2045207 RepID=A0A323TKB3_9BACI|nr:Cof-type HAD-IIB family hydrolase [Salipaludibacillus keqinensis]PYZ94097.1 haloacid dehalogenase [Salipaludibacillus keqinensis]
MAYRLLALDIDGTLLKSNHRLTKETKEAIDYVKDKGVYITLATGRSFFSARKVAKSLKLSSPFLITHDGTFLAEDVSSPVFERRLNAEKVYQVVDILENYHCHFRLFHEKYVIANKTKQKSQLISRVNLQMTDPLFYPTHYVESVSNRLIDQPLSVLNIRVQFWNKREQTDALEELQEALTGVRLFSSIDGEIHITHESTSKAIALQSLADRLGIKAEECVAIGADERDQDMIAFAGLGVAMGHAPASVKKIADWVTRSNDQSGVAYMIKEGFRKQLRIEVEQV